jgi:hypothetical protein
MIVWIEDGRGLEALRVASNFIAVLRSPVVKSKSVNWDLVTHEVTLLISTFSSL